MDEATQHHYDKHSRTSPMADCGLAECKKASRQRKADEVEDPIGVAVSELYATMDNAASLARRMSGVAGYAPIDVGGVRLEIRRLQAELERISKRLA